MVQKSNDPEVRRLLGVEDEFGKMLGLDNKWAYTIIKQVGNYGESYAKYFGDKSPLKLPRGLNALWRDGGLMYSMPFR
jgi:general L-amino acid transport system substrate-binding protein